MTGENTPITMKIAVTQRTRVLDLSDDVVVVVDVVDVIDVLVVVVVSLLPCNFSSTRLGGMRGTIESARFLVILILRILRILLILLLLFHLLLLLTLLPHVLTKAGDGGVHAARRPG